MYQLRDSTGVTDGQNQCRRTSAHDRNRARQAGGRTTGYEALDHQPQQPPTDSKLNRTNLEINIRVAGGAEDSKTGKQLFHTTTTAGTAQCDNHSTSFFLSRSTRACMRRAPRSTFGIRSCPSSQVEISPMTAPGPSSSSSSRITTTSENYNICRSSSRAGDSVLCDKRDRCHHLSAEPEAATTPAARPGADETSRISSVVFESARNLTLAAFSSTGEALHHIIMSTWSTSGLCQYGEEKRRARTREKQNDTVLLHEADTNDGRKLSQSGGHGPRGRREDKDCKVSVAASTVDVVSSSTTMKNPADGDVTTPTEQCRSCHDKISFRPGTASIVALPPARQTHAELSSATTIRVRRDERRRRTSADQKNNAGTIRRSAGPRRSRTKMTDSSFFGNNKWHLLQQLLLLVQHTMGKYTTGSFQLGRFDPPMAYVSKMGYDIGEGSYAVRFKTSRPGVLEKPITLKLAIFLDEDWENHSLDSARINKYPHEYPHNSEEQENSICKLIPKLAKSHREVTVSTGLEHLTIPSGSVTKMINQAKTAISDSIKNQVTQGLDLESKQDDPAPPELPVSPSEQGWSMWEKGALKQVIRPHVWYFVVHNCDSQADKDGMTDQTSNPLSHAYVGPNGGAPAQTRIKFRFQFEAKQHDGSHFSKELDGMLWVYFAKLMLFGVYGLHYFQLIVEYKRNAMEDVHPVIWILTSIILTQCVATVTYFIHLYAYSYNGYGVKALDVLNSALLAVTQVSIQSLLILIALGYTLLQKSLGDLDIVIPVIFVIVTVNVLLVGFSKLKDDASFKFMENEGWSGYLMVFIRLLLYCWFIYAIQQTRQSGKISGHGGKVNLFLNKFLVAGSLYFLSYPCIFAVSSLFAAYLRNKVMTTLGFLSFAMSIRWLEYLFLRKSDFYKVSTLGSSFLPGGVAGSFGQTHMPSMPPARTSGRDYNMNNRGNSMTQYGGGSGAGGDGYNQTKTSIHRLPSAHSLVTGVKGD
ncbi:unnamed protein product [Amoebophrya sp. A120]|nr:unnamed protein product [Amoebophrya sp. A120]|eukprot:GSA120T00009960001.1